MRFLGPVARALLQGYHRVMRQLSDDAQDFCPDGADQKCPQMGTVNTPAIDVEFGHWRLPAAADGCRLVHGPKRVCELPAYSGED